ncbi:MAG: helix-hairpin-helix domain-containing protein [Acidobacteriota bacterium]|jgi:competence ComEA-like helix-hairpin-helix protein|nr:helix-hairpin-helix domain-containing protein [Acidobacteriota bacterium]
MQKHKLYYFNSCVFLIKLLPLIIGCFLLGCSEQKEAQQVLPIQNRVQVAENAININTASAVELEKLPDIGAKTAQEIIEHREKYGRFRKPEHLLFVRGISDKRFRAMRSLIKIE